MSGLHVTWADLVIVGIVVISAIFATYRGFVRETLTIFAWAAAAFATLYFGHYAIPLMKDHFSPLVAQIAAYSIVFLLVLLPLSFVGYRFSKGVQDSPVGTLDRSLGAAFGILRGLAIVALAYIVFSLVIPVRAQPRWVENANLLPLVQGSADVLLSLIPEEHARLVHDQTTAGAEQEPTPAPQIDPKPRPQKVANAKKRGRKGYGADERRGLDRLFEATGSDGDKQQ